ncbi:glycosyltransferase family 4 protein [Streptomyces edwardsiae]|uniref:Glycosyltransferase family 4 protein n=1 Tax=Streptomyces edwardsiae TaxID=3075527 RepID=A0ABU2QE41_9ACTN|nr:glycosyltransferase family 4 protein [Streptomyces sp. DSM 41635]MDT0402733.1 glycosyltransferase family 4 protein [Streptomyces sp. DSM 41635]
MTAEASQAGPSQGPASDGLRPLRIALLTYKGNPFCGGQGVYVRHLSRELARLGHRVEVIGAQPYPVLDVVEGEGEDREGPALTELPSLDLYRQPDPFRTPGRGEYRDWIDALEVGTMWTGGFPEPLTFSLRARRHLRARRGDFDVVHDNQTLGYGLLGDLGAPLVTTVHHPITVDRRLELDAAESRLRRYSVRRWYAFTRMQKRVARRLPSVLTVSGSSRQEIVADLGVRRDRVHVVHIGADTGLFSPDPSVPVVPGRIVTTSSADVPLKGLVFLVEALAKVRAEQPDAHLVVVGKRPAEGPVAQAMERYGLEGAVEFVKGISDAELVDLVRSAQVACVPSLYEGFSLPAAEAMATGTPLVATTGGAIPEVAGPDGETCLAVPPGDPAALASALTRLLTDPDLRARLGAAGRDRVLRHFTWARAAEGTVAHYREAMARAGSAPGHDTGTARPAATPSHGPEPRGADAAPTGPDGRPAARAAGRAARAGGRADAVDRSAVTSSDRPAAVLPTAGDGGPAVSVRAADSSDRSDRESRATC